MGFSGAGHQVHHKLPKLYDTMTLRFRLSANGKQLKLTWSDDWHTKPDATTSHVPPLPLLERISINGEASSASGR
jgi:hypothetical protein